MRTGIETLSTATALLVAYCAAVAAGTMPQAASARTFEVASVKENRSGDNRVMMQLQPGGRLTVTNVPLRLLIRQAYRVQDYQIVGGPGWISSDRFDILAKAEGNPTPDETQSMLRALLEDRFKLAVHEETRDMPIYALVAARNDGKLGPKLTKSQQDCAAARGRAPASPPPAPPAGAGASTTGQPCSFRIGPGTINAQGTTLAQLATTLSMLVGRVVVDKSHLAGEYDIVLDFAPEGRLGGGPAAAPPGGPDAGVDRAPSDLPSVFTAIQEQLGLKLDSQRGPVTVTVIDRVERPTLD